MNSVLKEKTHLSSREVTELLGITPATLYAYVSRGLIRSEGEPNSRGKRYLAEDIQRLLEKKSLRQAPEQAVARSLDWGLPVLDTALCLIQNGQIYYRGQALSELMANPSFEAVLALLWQTELPDWSQLESDVPALEKHSEKQREPVLCAQRALLNLAEDPRCWDLRPEGVVRSGLAMLALLTRVFCGHHPQSEGLAHTLQAAWAADQPEVAAVLNQALMLSAEHELNISSFSVRCAASAGSQPVQAVLAGLASFSGSRHGGQWARVEALLRECEQADSVADALHSRLRRAESFDGFGHRLYPQGDPRWQALAPVLWRIKGGGKQAEFLNAVIDEVQRLTQQAPNLDFALLALCRLWGWPPQRAQEVFVLGRVVGWVAHLLEEYPLARLIRPRARYIGPLPESVEHADF